MWEIVRYAEFGEPSGAPRDYYPLNKWMTRLFSMAKASDANFGMIGSVLLGVFWGFWLKKLQIWSTFSPMFSFAGLLMVLLRLEVLHGVDLVARPGEITALVGPTGPESPAWSRRCWSLTPTCSPRA